MKVLITGAGGFIGSFMVEKALELGYETYAGIRSSTNKQYLQDSRIKFIDLKYSDKNQLVKQLEEVKQNIGGFDYIIHNAGVTKCNNKADFDKINYQFTKNFVEALVESNSVPTKFVYMSSLSAWGPGPENMEPIKLSDEPKPDTLYGKSKMKAERFIESVPNFPYVFLRPTGVYGPRETDYFVFNKTVKSGIEPSVGFSTQYITFIYVKDLVNLAFTAAQSNIKQKGYFITDGDVYTNTEYADIVKDCLNKKRTLKLKVPFFLVKGISYTMDTVFGWFGKSPTLNKDKYNILRVRNWKCEIEPLATDFNFKAEYNLKRGMQESIDWYIENKWM